MKKLFEKHETFFSIALIVIYLLANSLCLQEFDTTHFITAAVNLVLAALLLVLVFILGKDYYGFKKVKIPLFCLYFIPLFIISVVNLWNGFLIKYEPLEIVFHLLTMLGVALCEEIIFRSFLYRMMEKSNARLATVVSALTFGVGHIVNLFNGAEIVSTLIQICYATAIGFLFVIIFKKTGSILPCIISHAAVNMTSIFAVESYISVYITAGATILLAVSYALFINKFYNEKSLV